MSNLETLVNKEEIGVVQPPSPIHVTDVAWDSILNVHSNEEPFFRIAIEGGGCSGFQYALLLDDEKNEDDFVISKTMNGVELIILVDFISLEYLKGATIDFKDDIGGAFFSIENPNAQSTCGCGQSFS